MHLQPGTHLPGRQQGWLITSGLGGLRTYTLKLIALNLGPQGLQLLTAKLADPAFYKKEAAKFAEVKGRLDALEREHAVAFARWEELEALRAQV